MSCMDEGGCRRLDPESVLGPVLTRLSSVCGRNLKVWMWGLPGDAESLLLPADQWTQWHVEMCEGIFVSPDAS